MDDAHPDRSAPPDPGAAQAARAAPAPAPDPGLRAPGAPGEDPLDRREGRLRRAALRVWTLLGGIGLLVLGWQAFLRLDVVTVPLLLALFPTAAVVPLVSWLHRHRFSRSTGTSSSPW